MYSRKNRKKLSLSKETVKRLDGNLHTVHGGLATLAESCGVSCGGTCVSCPDVCLTDGCNSKTACPATGRCYRSA